LDENGISYEVDFRLVRGLDYYTNTVFEIVSEGLGAQNAICGGGAYEGLVEELGGPPTYAVGFAIGEDRLIEVLPEDSPARVAGLGPVLVSAMGKTSSEGGVGSAVVALLEDLRSAGVAAQESSGKGQRLFQQAESLGSPAVVFLGEDELAAGMLSVRTMESRQRADVIADLARRYGGG
jgi:histidyl-tRNA synthetase